MAAWVLIGVPSSAGAHHAGQERAPAALRQAGLLSRLRAAGLDITDAGDLPVTPFAVDHEHPKARNVAAVASVARRVADAVAGHLAAGLVPLVVGGDCTITLGVVAGFRRHHPDVGLIYADGDSDVQVPGTAETGSGICDATGVAHLLGHGAAELTGLAGESGVPLLDPARLAIVGSDPRETDDAGRRFLERAGVDFQEAPALIAGPAEAAQRALAAVAPAGGPVVVHFDVDLIDSGDLPLGNFPHYGSGVSLDHAVTLLRALRVHPSFAGMVLTEVNPTHDADGSQLERYVNAVVEVLAAPTNTAPI
ncbi:MAG TPA: arginase family protein [Actinocrinis sp.]|jgi:arginase